MPPPRRWNNSNRQVREKDKEKVVKEQLHRASETPPSSLVALEAALSKLTYRELKHLWEVETFDQDKELQTEAAQ